MNSIVNSEHTKIEETDKKFIVFRSVRLSLFVVEQLLESASSIPAGGWPDLIFSAPGRSGMSSPGEGDPLPLRLLHPGSTDRRWAQSERAGSYTEPVT